MALWPNLPTRVLQQTITPGEGVDTFRSPIQLSPGQASGMQNFGSGMYPALRTRFGRLPISSPCGFVHADWLHITPSNEIHIIDQNGVWKYWTGYSWKTIDSDNFLPGSMASWYNKTTSHWDVYTQVTNGGGEYEVSYWNGTAVTNIAHATFAPLPGPMCTHANRMVCTADDAINVLFFSKIGDPTTWTTPDAYGLPLGGGERVTALHSLSDRLFVGTTNGIYVVFGAESSDTVVVKQVSATIRVGAGNLTNYGSCSWGDSVYFTDMEKIYEYTPSSGIRDITRYMVGNGISGGIGKLSYPYLSLGTNGSVLVVATSSSSDPSPYWYVFDIPMRRWYVELGAVSDDGFTNQLVLFATDNSGRICFTAGTDSVIGVRAIDSDYTDDRLAQNNYIYDYRLQTVGEWTATGGADSVVAAVYRVTGNGSQAYLQTEGVTPKYAGNLTYMKTLVRVTDAVCQKLELIAKTTDGTVTVATQLAPAANTYYDLNGLADTTAIANANHLMSLVVKATYADAATANGKVMEVHVALYDDVSSSYVSADPPSEAEYEADMPSYTSDESVDCGKFFYGYNPVTVKILGEVNSYWISPAYEIRPTAKKTLANVWISVANIDATDVSVYVSNTVEGTDWVLAKTVSLTASTTSVTKIKVPISSKQKSDYIRIKVASTTGAYSIVNITLDWRIVSRAK